MPCLRLVDTYKSFGQLVSFWRLSHKRECLLKRHGRRIQRSYRSFWPDSLYYLHPNFMYASNERSGESVQLHRLARAVVARHSNKNVMYCVVSFIKFTTILCCKCLKKLTAERLPGLEPQEQTIYVYLSRLSFLIIRTFKKDQLIRCWYLSLMCNCIL